MATAARGSNREGRGRDRSPPRPGHGARNDARWRTPPDAWPPPGRSARARRGRGLPRSRRLRTQRCRRREATAPRSSVPLQLVEEAVDDTELVSAGNLVVDVLAYREVEHSEAERREHQGPVRR